METQEQQAGRKIKLDDTVYCPLPYKTGGQPECDHDFPLEPHSKSNEGAAWKCTRCGMTVSFDIWQ